MKKTFLVFVTLLISQISFAQYQYPKSKTVDVVETRWGMKMYWLCKPMLEILKMK